MPGGRFAPSDVTGKILTQWNERESTRAKLAVSINRKTRADRDDFHIGCRFPIRKRFQVDSYYEHENNTGKSPISK